LSPESVLEILKAGGPLAAFLKDYEYRPEQAEMMQRVIEAFNAGDIALIEAGTGTGKSLAYLIPAVIKAVYHKERTLISTKTINLQEQLIDKDLPLVAKALGVDFKAVLVKGMGNYLCLRKLQDSLEEELLLPPAEAKQLREINLWSQHATSGSKSELTFNPYASIWEKVNCEADTCTFRKCPFYEQCHFFRARQQAEEAQILVSNHHLLFADLSVREEEENYDADAVLPPYKHVVIDEAHHIEDVATEFFADHVSRIELMKTMGRLASEKGGDDAGRLPLLKKKLGHFYQKGPRDQMNALIERLTTGLPCLRKELIQQIADLFDAFTTFFFHIKTGAEEENKLRMFQHHTKNSLWGEEVVPTAEKCLHTAEKYVRMLLTLCKEVEEVEQPQLQEQVQGLLTEVRAFAKRLEDACQLINNFVFQELGEDRVKWIENHQLKTLTNLHLINAKLDISSHLKETLFSQFNAVIMCSATLSTNRNFEYFKKRLGLDSCTQEITEMILHSPFDFQKQALLLVPANLPPPNHREYAKSACTEILRAIRASHGNVFVLFTSYSLMQECYQNLAPTLKKLRFPVVKQGEDQRQALLQYFRKTERSVLFGTDSFWEGVDVAGEALRCVILVKLPFRVPSEPIFQARSEHIVKSGGDPFMDYALPGAVVKFKQGFGRLIRHQHDRGVVVVLDSRLMTKGYGKIFLRSLPDCSKQVTTDLEADMKEFYRRTYPLVANRNSY